MKRPDMKRHLAHWLMDQMWLCSKAWHGRIPFAPWCLPAWAIEECGRNHPEEWEEVPVEVARPLRVTRPARVDGMNVYVSVTPTFNASADLSKITKATIRGPIT